MASSDSSQHRALFVAGTVIADRYEVIDAIGKGGMGMVLRVSDRALNNEVIALKLLYPHMAKDQTQFARFQNEVLIARRLSHPNVVRLFDFGSAGQGYYYITMEYVEGGSLSQRIYGPKHNQLTFQESLEILQEICSGLSCAHAMGIVHRDLKPDNVLLTTPGQVKLSDFGLARSVGTDKGLTQTGDTVGTPYYMAPEQLKGEKPDHRVDIYALGILSYELFVGQRPFIHDNYLQLARKHFEEPIPRFATKENGIPLWAQEFVQRCAAKKKHERFQSVDEASAALAKHLGDSANGSVKRTPAVISMYKEERKTKRSAGKVAAKIALALLALVAVSSLVIFAFRSQRLRSAISELMSPPQVETAAANVSAALPAGFDTEKFFKLISDDKVSEIEAVFSVSPVDPNMRNAEGSPALHAAAQAGNLRIANLLIARGADPRAKNAQNRTALEESNLLGDMKMAELLKAAMPPQPNSSVQEQAEPVGAQAVTSKSAGTEPPLLKVRLNSKTREALEVPPIKQQVLDQFVIRGISVRGPEGVEARAVKLVAQISPRRVIEFPLGRDKAGNIGSKEVKDFTVRQTESNEADFRLIEKEFKTIKFSLTCENCEDSLRIEPKFYDVRKGR